MASVDELLSTDACTMPVVERPLRVAEFDDLFSSAVRGVERTGDRLTLRLAGDEGLKAAVRDLTERESACCSFFTFAISGTDQDLRLEIEVPPAQRRILDALEQRARERSTDGQGESEQTADE
ncbi:MAG: hypothetical protein J2O46_05355 [Nocardioides sp.]|nr:hypothetical protein [Nocardioides sp.]